MIRKERLTGLLSYSLIHLVVDMATVFVFFRAGSSVADIDSKVFLGLVYCLCAFTLQPLVGLIADRFLKARRTALIGCFGALISCFIPGVIIPVMIAGISNAFFHIGGGIYSLEVRRGKAWPIGLFVAPGAIGLLLGGLLGNGVIPYGLPVAVIALAVSIYFIRNIRDIEEPAPHYMMLSGKIFVAAAVLLMIAIGLRGFVGMAVSFPWKSIQALLVTSIIAVFLGKLLGGFFADKFGQVRVATMALGASAVLMVAGGRIAFAGLLGLFLFQFAMPIALLALWSLMPKNPGFAFGLNCLALSVGAFPIFFGASLASPALMITLVIFAAMALAVGIRMGERSVIILQ